MFSIFIIAPFVVPEVINYLILTFSTNQLKMMNQNKIQFLDLEKFRFQLLHILMVGWAAGLGWGFHTQPLNCDYQSKI